MSGDGKFLNPYTFVPAFPRDGLPEQLRDAPPPSRDRLHPGRWTGRIGVVLTVETPLLLLDTARDTPSSTGDTQHKVYPVRLRNGRPHLPATSVKGMLRAAYEAITNSRFGVFDGHDEHLGFRRDAGYALGMVPVYVAREGVLYRDYRDAHNDAELRRREASDGRVAGPGERIGDGPGQLAWSPHIHDEERMRLKPRTLCYARLDEQDRVDRLYPVLVPRDLYPVAPSDLLSESLKPAPCYDELSPADRVFGWVAPPHGKGVRPAAYRGRLRIGPVICDQDAEQAVERFDFDGDGLPLAILGAPKPQQGRFYVSESALRPDLPVKDGTPKDQLYQAGRALRGRKAYWHHAGLDARQHWNDGQGRRDPGQVRIGTHYREYRRSRTPFDDKGTFADGGKSYQTTGSEQRDTQNRSIKGWVRPATSFRFAIDVRDLDDCELGALTWLLTLPPRHFHRLGLGRPLGFGSVRLDIDAECTELHSGEQFADYYRSLSASLPAGDAIKILNRVSEEFTRLVESSDQLLKIREAVLAVARGNREFPVHYPRVRPRWLPKNVPAPPDPRGRNHEWFTENERVGKSTEARGRSLPGAVEPEPALEVYPARDENGQDASGKGAGRNRSFNSLYSGRAGNGSSNDRRR